MSRVPGLNMDEKRAWTVNEPFLFWEYMGLVHLTGLYGLSMERWTRCGTYVGIDPLVESHQGPVTCLECMAQVTM